ncbi:hypothetical protein RHGRI_010351 [Rhododendron griersonianum]|uniref:Uncharacterized protein n=1 Tax=Rhododendron griersonianum TaxID=479676 RepID=A0AAV6KIH6_9ERIC|nr:hypothetical protein RHGRI_010351 [Rhododendron griersonianum]
MNEREELSGTLTSTSDRDCRSGLSVGIGVITWRLWIPRLQRLKRRRERRSSSSRPSLWSLTTRDLCGGSNRFKDYEQSIPVNNEEENVDAMDSEVARKLASYTAPKSTLKDKPRGMGEDLDEELKRLYAFAAGDKTPDLSGRTFQDVIQEYELRREKEKMLRAITKEEEERKAARLVSRTDENLLETFQRVCFTHWCTLLLQIYRLCGTVFLICIGGDNPACYTPTSVKDKWYTGFPHLGQMPRTQASLSYRTPIMGPLCSTGFNQTSRDAVYMQWPTSAMMYAQSYEQFRHAVFQAPYIQQPLSFDYSQNH